MASKETTDDVHIDLDQWNRERAAYMQFPPEFDEICKLDSITKFIQDNGLDELKRRLGDVVFLHKERFHSPKGQDALNGPYFNNVRQVANWCEQAHESVDNILETAWLIDADHWDLILTAAHLSFRDEPVSEEVPALGGPNPLEGMHFPESVGRLTAVRDLLGSLAFAIKAGTAVKLGPRSKGRQSSPHVWPAFELMELWTELTGEVVAEPKLGKEGKNNKVAIQDSANFVFLALKMIDPKATPENARTAIRRAREIAPETYGKAATQDL